MKNFKHILILTVSCIFIISCKNEKDKSTIETIEETSKEVASVFDDSKYILNNKFPLGDVRRYGIYPDSIHPTTHPYTKNTRLTTVLDLSENHGVELTFPKGYYKKNLVIKGRKNININFENAEFAGMIQVYENDSIPSENIVFKGNVVSYAGFLVRKSHDLEIENLSIKSNLEKNIYGLRSKGAIVDAGSEDIKINKLVIEDLGSGSDKYKFNGAALSIQGWNNNPVNVQIKDIHILSSDRHGMYITGKDHLIGNVVIDKFGVGSSKGMSGMQDADKGEEKEFKALWVNRCYNSFIENITINEKDSKGKYTAYFDQGSKTKPFTIGTFKVINDNPSISVLKAPNTGVIVEIEE
ncbi:hypothetical protein AAFN75_06250 [Algibacter sp. AS12]|uniref:hypothetical protein n=1 Tax=Algibacter sp. AS12 TaxID=3135773 RepID=UPI00398B5855